MGKLLRKFWDWLFSDEPSISWSDGRFDRASLFDDRHTHRLAWLLYYYQPELLQRWYEVVLRAAVRAEEEDKILRNVLARREDLAAKAACIVLAPLPHSTWKIWDFFLSVSKSFLLFLGILQLGIFGLLERQSSNPKNPVTVAPDAEILLIQPKETGFFSFYFDYWIFVLVGLAIAAVVYLILAANRGSIKRVKATRSDEPIGLLDFLLPIGLSFMLFLGISEYLGIEVQSIAADQWLLVGLAIAAAVCLTLAAKKGIIKWVKATRYYEPKRSFDDRPNALPVPFWLRLRRGDAAVWLTILVVVFEMMFAAPGLIGFLPPRLAAQPLFQISAFVATGLAALVNAFLAWGIALEQIRLEREAMENDPQQELFNEEQTAQQEAAIQAQVQREIEAERRQMQRQAIEAKARLQVVQKQIEEQQRVFLDAKRRAIAEHKRWERAVRKWMRSHPEIVEQFGQLYPHIEQGFPQPLAKNILAYSETEPRLKSDANSQKPI